MNNHDELIASARAARENAVATFSKYKVGAAIATADGVTFGGCNIENCTYGLTVCAERVALFTALAAGARRFTAVAVVTDSPRPATPCGPCRQLLWEFGGDLDVILANLDGATTRYKLSELLPHPFVFAPEES